MDRLGLGRGLGISAHAEAEAGLTQGVILGNRLQAYTGVATIAANFTSRRPHWTPSGGVCTNFRRVDLGWYIKDDFTIANSDAHTIACAFEYPAGVIWPVTRSGASSWTIGTGNLATSDIVEGLSIPPNTQYWELTANLNASVTNFPVVQLPAGASTIGATDGNLAGNWVGGGGTFTPTAGTNVLGAALIYGDILANNIRSVIQIGDSLTWGQGDEQSVGEKQGSGYLDRALDLQGIGHLKIAKKGWEATLLQSNMTAIAALISKIDPTVSVLHDELGINDIRLNSSQAHLFSDKATIYAALANGRDVIGQTFLPRTTSTDSWASEAAQTLQTDGNMANWDAICQSIMAGGVSGMTRAIDVRAIEAVVNASSSYAHRVESAGLTGSVSADGTHPISDLHNYIAHNLGTYPLT